MVYHSPVMSHSSVAPFHSDVTTGSENARAVWRSARDGVRVRIGIWPEQTKAKGTLLLFPGRTEYIEKYGHVAAHFAKLGLAVISIDWRGQGLADRLAQDRFRGHVGDFADYQLDVQAMLEVAREEKLPEPFYLLAHSMGGAIALRALHEGVPVEKVGFSAPMWGIKIDPPILRPTAWVVSRLAHLAHAGETLTPGTQPRSFILSDPFENNTLTRDPDMWALMGDQIRAMPDVELGGPSLDWVRLAISECAELMAMTAPPHPCLTFLGSNERIVSVPDIHHMMDKWDNGTLELVPGAEHEVLMDLPDTRARVLDAFADHFLG